MFSRKGRKETVAWTGDPAKEGVVRHFWKLVRRVGTSWRVVTSFGALLTAAGVTIWTFGQSSISLAQSSAGGYGAVGGASTTGGVGAASTTLPPTAGAVGAASVTSSPITGAGLFWPAMVLLVGLICVGVGFYLRRRASAQTTD
jgi:hypothetical protein